MLNVDLKDLKKHSCDSWVDEFLYWHYKNLNTNNCNRMFHIPLNRKIALKKIEKMRKRNKKK